MSSIESISQYIYPDNEQQQAEFVQHYRAATALKCTLLKELLPNISDTQIAELLHEYTVKRARRSIARNRRLWFVWEFLYYSRLESLIRVIKCFIECTKPKLTKKTPVYDRPIKWGSRNHKCYLLEQHPRLDVKTVSKVLKITTNVAKEYKTCIKSKESNRTISLSQQA